MRIWPTSAKYCPYNTPGRYRTTHLNSCMQQLPCQTLERDAGFQGESCLLVQQRDPTGISSLLFGVKIFEGLEVIMYGMAHHDLVFQDLQDLEVSEGGELGSKAKVEPSAALTGLSSQAS